MNKRTLEELHDKYVGHKKFASVCDILINKGYVITDIKEYYEQFKFKVNGYQCWYRKEWKASAEEYADYVIKTINQKEELIKLVGDK